MPMNFPYDFAAQLLAEAAINGSDTITAKAHGVTTQTIRNYRRRLADDEVLLQIFAHKKAKLEKEWAHEVAPTIRESLRYLQRAAKQKEYSAETIHAVAGAVKIVSEAQAVLRYLDSRIHVSSDTEDGSAVSAVGQSHTAALPSN